MRSAFRDSLLVALVLGACAKAGGEGPPVSAAADARQAVQKRMSDYADVIRSARADQVRGFWSDSALVQEPGREIRGGEAMTAAVRQRLSSLTPSRFALVTSEIAVHDGGMVGYAWAKLDEASGDGSRAENNVLLRWVKESDGVWRVDRLMETPMPPDPDQAEQAPAR